MIKFQVKKTENLPTFWFLLMGLVLAVLRIVSELLFRLEEETAALILQGVGRLWLCMLIALFCYDRYRMCQTVARLKEAQIKLAMEAKKKEETMEENVRRRYDDISWMKSMMTHNVRMPLSIIDGYGQLLRRGMIRDEKQKKECLDKICGNIDYLKHIVALVLDSDQAPIQYEFREIDLIACIREVCAYVESATRRANIRIVLNTSQETLKAEADYIQIMRIFYNMFENSFKYLSPQGSIVITIDRINEDEVLLVYKDNGSGMAKEETKHIFEERFQGSNSRKGSGMGMSFVKEVVETHGGQIGVQSDIGKGMGIYIRLPVRHPQREGEAGMTWNSLTRRENL